jgi:hypothetical protein
MDLFFDFFKRVPPCCLRNFKINCWLMKYYNDFIKAKNNYTFDNLDFLTNLVEFREILRKW